MWRKVLKRTLCQRSLPLPQRKKTNATLVKTRPLCSHSRKTTQFNGKKKPRPIAKIRSSAVWYKPHHVTCGIYSHYQRDLRKANADCHAESNLRLLRSEITEVRRNVQKSGLNLKFSIQWMIMSVTVWEKKRHVPLVCVYVYAVREYVCVRCASVQANVRLCAHVRVCGRVHICVCLSGVRPCLQVRELCAWLKSSATR